jgi:hypothetical protein
LKTFYRKFFSGGIERGMGDGTQGFRRMAAGNKPAGIRVLVYGMDKGKVRIEGLSVSGIQANKPPNKHDHRSPQKALNGVSA